jgi:asparaginyl-tRNA synthetase
MSMPVAPQVEPQRFDSVADVLAGLRTGQPVRLRGWVHRQRTAGKMAFVVLRDGSGTVQCTVKGGVADDASLEAAKAATLESSVRLLEGTAVADERAPGGFEVKATRFELHSKSEPFPLRGEQGTEFELDKRHLWLRSTELSAILRIKHRLYKAVHDFYDAEGFAQVDPSVITTNACEGGSTLFTFGYFGQTAYLSQSAQMYLEGCIFGMPKVYSITNSFRAEKSRTSKHLTEFHHLEAEYAWWDAEDSRKHQEKLVTHLAHTIGTECAADLKVLGQDPARLLKVQAPFERIDYAEAIQELVRQGFHIAYGDDFGVPHEKALTEGRTSPIFVCDWPAKIKAFYMAEKPGTDRVLCSDLLAPDGYGEIIGGSQRSEDIESMKRRLLAQWHAMGESAEADDRRQFQHERKAIADRLGKAATDEQVDAEYLRPYDWYFDLRRYGSVPHSGFGLGIERLLRWFTGQEHIRDMLPYPRTPSRAYP